MSGPPDGPGAYGDAFADVYDDWYRDVSDVEATVAALLQLAGGRPLLELGVGTGRIAIPLGEAGASVHGVDASAAMLRAMAAKPGAERVTVTLADMARLPLVGPFGLVFVVVNTFFNLTTEADQRLCVAGVSEVLEPGGRFVVEAFVPDPDLPETGREERSSGAGSSVIITTRRDPEHQTVQAVHEHTDAAGAVIRRPWTIRYVSPHQLDDMCDDAGLPLEQRWRNWAGTPFDPAASHHVSVYRKPGP